VVDTLGSARDYSDDQLGSGCQFGLVSGPAFRHGQDVDSASDNQETDLYCQDAWRFLEVLVLRQADAFLETDACRAAVPACRPVDALDGLAVVASVRLSSSSENSVGQEVELDSWELEVPVVVVVGVVASAAGARGNLLPEGFLVDESDVPFRL
jgi:hypothetical protein